MVFAENVKQTFFFLCLLAKNRTGCNVSHPMTLPRHSETRPFCVIANPVRAVAIFLMVWLQISVADCHVVSLLAMTCGVTPGNDMWGSCATTQGNPVKSLRRG